MEYTRRTSVGRVGARVAQSSSSSDARGGAWMTTDARADLLGARVGSSDLRFLFRLRQRIRLDTRNTVELSKIDFEQLEFLDSSNQSSDTNCCASNLSENHTKQF